LLKKAYSDLGNAIIVANYIRKAHFSFTGSNEPDDETYVSISKRDYIEKQILGGPKTDYKKMVQSYSVIYFCGTRRD
jgi:hypothetical protein